MDADNSGKKLWKKVCQESDLNAFESLFYIFNKRLIRFSELYVKSKEAAEEIVSDVFVNCWQDRSEKGKIENIESYLFISVRNRSINYVKKYSAITWNRLNEDNKYDLSDIFDPQRQFELKELYLKMEEAVDALPLQSKLVFKLVRENGMKYKEAAEILDISPKTVQTLLYRTIKKLTAIFDRDRVQKPNGIVK